MDGIYTFNKERGETLAVALKRFKAENAIPEGISVTYAGRLDPLAEGALIFLVGEAVHQKDKYLGLSKTYRVTILVGFETDTYDLLGIPGVYQEGIPELEKKVQTYTVPYTFAQTYPLYSSKTVHGKPLFMYAREGEEVTAPTHEVTLQHIAMLDTRTIKGEALLKDIEELLTTVEGDFRQELIGEKWKHVINSMNAYTLYDLELTVSSGFYVRTFVHDLGRACGIPMCVHTLVRTHINEMSF